MYYVTMLACIILETTNGLYGLRAILHVQCWQYEFGVGTGVTF